MEQRLLSLDTFRGMTIFFMILVNTPGSWNYVYAPLKHASWDGCTPTDLVFPFFMLIVGISMALSFNKFDSSKHHLWISKALVRGFKIILIGLLLNWFPFFNKNIENLRIFGVLQRIGIAFILASFIIVYVNGKRLWLLLGIILFGYWVLLLTAGEGALTLEGNLVRKIDIFILGTTHIYKGFGLPFDPEGLLSTISATGNVLLGFIIGQKLLIINEIEKKIKWSISTGLVLIVLGLLWSYAGFPINKPIWSSSYVLFTSGLGMVVLAILIWIIDVQKIYKWAYVFKAFGQNPLISFIFSGLIVKIISLIKIGDQSLYNWLYSYIFQDTFGDYLGSFIFAFAYVLVIWSIAWFMDRKGIIVKV